MTAQKNEFAGVDASYLEGFEGSGLETIGNEACAQPYLSMVQPGSKLEVEGGHKVGTWVNSATGQNFGEIIRVVPVAFKTIWNERDSQSFTTVGRYEPNSIEVTFDPIKPGKKGYPKMRNPKTGNEVQELFMYAVVLADAPDAGILLFNPTVVSMKACKSWNSQLRSQLLPNGQHAPIFGFSWNLALEMVPNPNRPNEQIAKLTRVERAELVGKELFETNVKPQVQIAQRSMLSLTADEDAVEE